MSRKKKRHHRANSSFPHTPPPRQLKPKTINQSKYIKAMIDSDVILCSGPPGSGKTAVSVGMACQYLLQKQVDKIVIARPTVEVGKGLGYLPGTIGAKIQPYLVPVLEEMGKYFSPDAINSFRGDHTIELCPLEYMRGRNFHHSFMILDEAQNATFEQLKMFITRMGRGSKAVLNGDLQQSDLDTYMRGGFKTCIDKLDNVEGISICTLGNRDIIRNDIIARILNKLNT